MKFGDVLTYHCQCCGSNMDIENGKCWYCGSTKMIRIPHKDNEQIRLFADLGDRKFYFHEVLTLETIEEEPAYIDTARFYDGTLRRCISSRRVGNAGLTIAITNDSVKKLKMIQEKSLNTYKPVLMGIEIPSKTDLTFAFKAYLADRKANLVTNCLATMDLGLILDDVIGWGKHDFNVVPEETSCPNCGAKVTKQFGLCDYCGGWIEYNDRF